MYCRMCGNSVKDTDHYCQYCGSPTGFVIAASDSDSEENREEVVFNPPFDKKSQFAEEEPVPGEEEPSGSAKADAEEESLKEFISLNEINSQKREVINEQQTGKSGEFTWNVHEFPAVKKTEEIEFNWNMGEFGQQEQKDAAAVAFEEELFQEIREESSRIREQNIDRFFTFSRKNEEFQKLLDREYEKFKTRTEPAGTLGHAEIADIVWRSQKEAAAAAPGESRFNETPLDTQIPLPEEVSEEQTEPAEPKEPAQAKEPEQTLPVKAQKTEQLSEMAQARALFFGEDLIRDNESIKRKLTSEEAGDEQAEKLRHELSESPGDEPEAEAPGAAEKPEAEAPGAAEEPEAEAPGASEEPEAEAPGSWDETAKEQKTEEEEKPKRNVGQIILVIIAIILSIEIIILGIRYFAPESLAARVIIDTQTQIFQTMSGWTDKISDLFNGEDSGSKEDNDAGQSNDLQEDPDEELTDDEGSDRPEPDPNPMADKNALVSSQLGNNINIEQVRANEALAYQQGRDYGLADINHSKPIANNIWLRPQGGEPVYYDRAIVGTVIAFDSQWIDYVNGGSRSALDLLKKDSEAYRKAASFSKVGKIKETFKLLEIGEIRQGANGFYIWVHEEIQITEKGVTKNIKYNWIYHLEPIDGKMQIVNYFKFQ